MNGFGQSLAYKVGCNVDAIRGAGVDIGGWFDIASDGGGGSGDCLLAGLLAEQRLFRSRSAYSSWSHAKQGDPHIRAGARAIKPDGRGYSNQSEVTMPPRYLLK